MSSKIYIPRKIRHCLSIVRRTLQHFSEWNQDAWRFFKASTVTGNYFGNDTAHLESDIIRLYHVVEKSLSMPAFRPRSSLNMVRQLQASLDKWDGLEGPHIASARVVLEAYRKKHEELGVDISDVFSGGATSCILDGQGGVKPYHSHTHLDREVFLRVMIGRVSVRNFDVERIPDQKILGRAVTAAMSSPSVCNRQTSKAYCFTGQRARELLALQNGNRGFGHTIPAIFIVTSDLRLFTGTTERYQAWIDGGMFAMSLLLGLHGGGLGALALNWSVLNRRDRELRQAASIPDHERIIMLIGCGYPTEGAVVPVSTRRDLEEVFILQES
ncbi:MAG: nitroreductase family protein [Rubritalea sp.]